MILKEFATQTGIEYPIVSAAMNCSRHHVHGRNVDYMPEQIREAVMDYLKDKEKTLEHKLAEVRRGIVNAHNMGGGGP